MSLIVGAPLADCKRSSDSEATRHCIDQKRGDPESANPDSTREQGKPYGRFTVAGCDTWTTNSSSNEDFGLKYELFASRCIFPNKYLLQWRPAGCAQPHVSLLTRYSLHFCQILRNRTVLICYDSDKHRGSISSTKPVTAMVSEARGLSILFPTYQIFTAIAFFLCVIPIPAHWRAGNVATVSLGLWNAGGSLIALINTLVWRGNLKNPYPIWGDITAFYWANMGVAIASCSLAVIHQLYNVSKSRKVLVTKTEVRPIL